MDCKYCSVFLSLSPSSLQSHWQVNPRRFRSLLYSSSLPLFLSCVCVCVCVSLSLSLSLYIYAFIIFLSTSIFRLCHCVYCLLLQCLRFTPLLIVWINGVNFVPYLLVRPEFIVSIGEPVQKYPWFIPLKIPVLTGLYRTYCRILDISTEKWKTGSTKNLKKMEKISSRKLTMPYSLVVFACCQPFPQPSSFYFIQPLLFFLLLLQFWPNLSSIVFCFSCVCVWLLFNCSVCVALV